MTYEDILRVNAEVKTTPIKGKDYAEVNERIKAFRKLFPMGSITTEILSLENGMVVIRATVTGGGEILATGTAYEREGSSNINKTSFIENCETSAVGRALGMLALGIDTSVASYEEVKHAIDQQDNTRSYEDAVTSTEVAAIFKRCEAKKVAVAEVCKAYNVENVGDLNWGQYLDAMKRLDATK